MLPRGVVSVCPVATAQYQWLSSEGELVDFEPEADGFVVGGGLGIGAAVGNQRGMSIIPHGRALLVHDRAQVEFAGIDGLQIADLDTYGLFDAGVLFGTRSVYFGPAVRFTTGELQSGGPSWD